MEEKHKILVVEDESDISELLEFNLLKEGYKVEISDNGEDALERAQKFQPELILLDLMLPGIGGLEVCRRLRTTFERLPIIMVTAKGSEADKILGFESGADDYIVKPFKINEVLVRVRAHFRRGRCEKQSAAHKNPSVQNRASTTEDFPTYDSNLNVLKFQNDKITLTETEGKLLGFLMSKPNMSFSRSEIMKNVISEANVSERTIDVHIAALRKKLSHQGKRIKTVRGIGYRFSNTG